MKINVIMWVVFTILLTFELGVNQWILVPFANLLLALVALYLTKRHLWATDLLSLLFSFGLCLNMTIFTFFVDYWNEFGDLLIFRINMTLIFF